MQDVALRVAVLRGEVAEDTALVLRGRDVGHTPGGKDMLHEAVPLFFKIFMNFIFS